MPATSSTPPLPPSADPVSSKPVVLYRDVNAWCPYCQKVWMALLEKGIEFDSVLIDLFNKPEWYADVIESKQTPAARIHGEFVGESNDIMLRLEEEFASSPSLLPAAHAEDIRAFLNEYDAISSKVFIAFRAGDEPTAEEEESLSKVEAFLDACEARIKENGGPYLFGEFSLADITVAPFMPRLLLSGNPRINLSQHPHVEAAIQALNERPSMQATRVDDHTRTTLFTRLFSNPDEQEVPPLDVPEPERKSRCEAAAKIAANRDAVRARLLSHSGVVRASGSPFGETVENVNGRYMNPHAVTFEAEVDRAMLRVCGTLLTGHTGKSPPSKEAVAIQVAAIAYLRNLGSSPRDMTAPAMDQLRAACDAVITAAYEFPERRG